MHKLRSQGLLQAVHDRMPARDYRETAYFAELGKLQDEWNNDVQGPLRTSNSHPMTQQRAMTELRNAVDRRTIITAGAGMTQMIVHQDFPVYEPRTHLFQWRLLRHGVHGAGGHRRKAGPTRPYSRWRRG